MVMKTLLRGTLAALLVPLAMSVFLACGDDEGAPGQGAGAPSAPTEPAATGIETEARSSDVGRTIDPITAAKFETCSGFLALEDLSELAGRSDISLAPLLVNTGLMEPNQSGIRAHCVLEYTTPDGSGAAQSTVAGASLTINAWFLTSAEIAELRYNIALERAETVREDIASAWDVDWGMLGNLSHQLRVDARGVGSVLGFSYGPYVIGISTTLPEGATPLVTVEELQSLADTLWADLGGK